MIKIDSSLTNKLSTRNHEHKKSKESLDLMIKLDTNRLSTNENPASLTNRVSARNYEHKKEFLFEKSMP